MCIRDSPEGLALMKDGRLAVVEAGAGRLSAIDLGSGEKTCLLYTSDAADERSSVDLGGRRILKKKKNDNAAAGHECITTNTKNK